MTASDASPIERRVLLRMVTARDGAMAVRVLAQSGVCAEACRDAAQIATLLREGAGALLIAEEVLSDEGFAGVKQQLLAQEPWSDLPVLVLARAGVDSLPITDALQELANLTVLERPMRVSSLVSATRSALAARRRQYQLRGTLLGLQEADKRKTEFLATLAHELRNPLAPLRTGLELLAKRNRDTEEDWIHALMSRQVSHMVRLIDDLMEVSRITRGKIELQFAPVAMQDVLRHAVELSLPLIDAHAHHLTMDIPDERVVVHGDSVRLTQVFSNLLNNAAKYTPRGGELALSLQHADTQARVTVSDNGPGIPPDMREAVFDLFVQVNDASRAAQGGLGIGLTLVRSLVELHGGTVKADSAGGTGGTRMVVRLPRAMTLASEATSPVAGEALRCAGGRQRVLVVDDNADAADTLAALLQTLGVAATVAYSGAGALQAMEERSPTLALLDIGMPGMDGFALAERIRGNPAWSPVTLVALTGWAQKTDRERTAAARFDHHLVKPVDLGELIRILNELP
ncbi:hybrid sensor histidine kinase/response regulator [uncultured Hydrogenophaga sp.]|uniref:hybrid sensor histidine kinase/response regulator n=1 Tax=uncultured Hydrogenophaga sp. TaxID=199683 RepID=UPI00258FB2ED|nr:hybrid sensor histidine kinase/response regulator [uncultured Hydrogenophaga sp.]